MPTTWLDTLNRQTRRLGAFPYPHQLSFLLNNPVRGLTAHREQVFDQLSLTGSERVLELGPGSGFFSVDLARRLPDGHLDLFDVQPEMLDKARRNLEAAGHHDVGFHAGEAGAGLPFDDATFDLAFLAYVIGEVPDQRGCIRALSRVIKPGGHLVFVEGFPDPDRMNVESLRSLAEAESFTLVDATGNWLQDIVRFRRN